MWLHGKSAVIYGANNPAGASVARALAREGATIYLAGRSPEDLKPVADDIETMGGTAYVARVDPLDPKSVSEHLHQVVVQHGTVDLSLNLAFQGIEAPARLCNLNDEQFAAATFTRVLSNFVTTAAVASEMSFQGQGTIVASAGPARGGRAAQFAGEAIGSAAIEALCEQLRVDVGSYGVRVAFLPDPYRSDAELVQELLRVLETVSPAISEGRDITQPAAFSPPLLRNVLGSPALTR